MATRHCGIMSTSVLHRCHMVGAGVLAVEGQHRRLDGVTVPRSTTTQVGEFADHRGALRPSLRPFRLRQALPDGISHESPHERLGGIAGIVGGHRRRPGRVAWPPVEPRQRCFVHDDGGDEIGPASRQPQGDVATEAVTEHECRRRGRRQRLLRGRRCWRPPSTEGRRRPIGRSRVGRSGSPGAWRPGDG